MEIIQEFLAEARGVKVSSKRAELELKKWYNDSKCNYFINNDELPDRPIFARFNGSEVSYQIHFVEDWILYKGQKIFPLTSEVVGNI